MSETRIGIRTSKAFKNKLDSYSKSEGLTLTQFIISAINEKIERIENPNHFTSSAKNEKVQIELAKHTKTIMNGLTELKMLQKTSIFLEKNGTRYKPKPDIEDRIMVEFNSKLIDRTKEPLTIDQLVKRTQLDSKEVYDFVMNSKELIPKGRGFVKNAK